MPKVSIIIPVYNVEKYLAECLDSVIGQTLRDIEIICVDDGSTDRSPEILDEYAKKDSRITVIHKKNGGLSSARNTAYSHIKGEYTLFVDSDDYIELTLCEKVVAVAEREQADMTFFFYKRTSNILSNNYFESFLTKNTIAIIDKRTLLTQMTVWSKLWQTTFLFNNDILFPEGICFEDNVVHWKAVIQNPKLAVLKEHLYWYRVRDNSITANMTEKLFKDLLYVYEYIKEILFAEKKYCGEWKEIFLETKLRSMVSRYHDVPKAEQPTMLVEIRASIGEDERNYLNGSHNLPWYVTDFYNALDGSKIAKIKCMVNFVLRSTRQTFRLHLANVKEKLRKTA
jgi:glycosyltransferase involved in cell wall biosynthesis